LGVVFGIGMMAIPFVLRIKSPMLAAVLFDGGLLAAIGCGMLLLVDLRERMQHGA
jgi:hypothetical protein